MGRSPGGLTTKLHAVVDANGNPIILKLTEGQARDCRSADDMLDSAGNGQTLLGARYEKHDTNYMALLKLASARIWMRFMSR